MSILPHLTCTNCAYVDWHVGVSRLQKIKENKNVVRFFDERKALYPWSNSSPKLDEEPVRRACLPSSASSVYGMCRGENVSSVSMETPGRVCIHSCPTNHADACYAQCVCVHARGVPPLCAWRGCLDGAAKIGPLPRGRAAAAGFSPTSLRTHLKRTIDCKVKNEVN